MAYFKYRIVAKYNGVGKDIDIGAENLIGVVIDYPMDTEAIQPMLILKVRLDKNNIDHMIKNKDKGRILLRIDKVDVSNATNTSSPYIYTQCIYEIMDDTFSDKTILYDKDSEKKDAYAQVSLGLLSEDIIERNVVNQDCIIKEGNMMGAVCLFTQHMPMVIEPFTYNADIDELIISPLESTKEMIKYLTNIKVFYDTPLRYFMDFNATYLLSSRGVKVEVQGEESSTVIISLKESDKDPDALELGINYNSESKCYDFKVLTNDAQYVIDNTQNKTVNKLVGILDPSREQSNPGLAIQGIIDALTASNGIIKAVRNCTPSIGDGINNVIHGKNVYDFNTQEIKDLSNAYHSLYTSGRARLYELIELYYQTAIKKIEDIQKAAENQTGVNAPYIQKYYDELKEKIKKIYEEGKAALDSMNTQEEINEYIRYLLIGQVRYDELSGKAANAGYSITSYESLINGVTISDLYKNIDEIVDRRPVNEINNEFIEQKAVEARDALNTSTGLMNQSIDNTINSFSAGKKCLNDLHKYLGTTGSSPTLPGGMSSPWDLPSDTEAPQLPENKFDHKKNIAEIDDYITKINNTKSTMVEKYSYIEVSVDEGVQYSQDLFKAQTSISPLGDQLGNLQGFLQGAFGQLIGGLFSGGGLTDITDSLNTFGSSLMEQIESIGQNALNNLGIGNINELMNGGIDSVANLTDVGKTGLTFLETGILNILNTGMGDKVKYVDLGNDDPNKIKAIQKGIENKGTRLTITKDLIDNSILTLNKEYLVNNVGEKAALNGRYILVHKQEIYMREGDLFICRTIADFNKISEN